MEVFPTPESPRKTTLKETSNFGWFDFITTNKLSLNATSKRTIYRTK